MIHCAKKTPKTYDPIGSDDFIKTQAYYSGVFNNQVINMTNKFLTPIIILIVLSACTKHQNLNKKLTHDQRFWGLWTSMGYGYLMHINNKGIDIYDYDQKYCKKQAIEGDDASALFRHYEWYNDERMGIGQSKHSKIYQFKKINQLPQKCQLPIENTPSMAFDYFTNLMSEHYAYFDLYGVNWQKRVSEVQHKINDNMSESELADVFKWLIRDINDGHLYIQASINGEKTKISNDDSRILTPAIDAAFAQQSDILVRSDFGRAWYENHLENTYEHLLSNAQLAANNQIIWGSFGDIGYINILNMHGLSKSGLLHDELRAINKAFTKIIPALSSSSGIIIDVTTNSGGSDEIGREIVNYFTDQQIKLYSHNVLGALQDHQVYYSRASEQASNSAIYLGPVYIYTSDHTVSAAETFVMGMKALPNVTHVGSATRGAFSDILDKTLPNGWEVGLSNMFYRDVNGINWESRGLQPDIDIPVFSGEDIFNSHLNATRKLIEIIAKAQS